MEKNCQVFQNFSVCVVLALGMVYIRPVKVGRIIHEGPTYHPVETSLLYLNPLRENSVQCSISIQFNTFERLYKNKAIKIENKFYLTNTQLNAIMDTPVLGPLDINSYSANMSIS